MEGEDSSKETPNSSRSTNPFLSASANIFQNTVNQLRAASPENTSLSSNSFGTTAPQSGIFTPQDASVKRFSQTLRDKSGFQNFTSLRRKRRSVESESITSAAKHYLPSVPADNPHEENPFEQHNISSSPTNETVKPMMDRPRLGAGIKRPIVKSKLRRLSTPSETSSAIVCINLPTELNKKEFLVEHFSQFGKILKIQTNALKKTAYLCFSSNDEATNAKRKGANLSPDHSPVKILYVKTHTKTADRTPASSSNLHSAPMSWVKGGISSATGSGKASADFVPRSTGFDLYAKTDKEKLEMLEKIDTLLRKQIVKQSDITKAKIFKGTCQDMCPEKERYLRQDRNILAPYEMSQPGIVDHALAIKEYSRSSADQEEPLSQDLRPSSAIHLSMMYLMINIIPKMGDGDIAEWYDFIWNRTRAIRKELSIQQIKDPMAISVIEQCARFHIFCAHHLVHHDRINFDPKINNENLEKTMKTLLDMYHDTKDVEGSSNDSFFTSHSNQAEFYSYYIMLNMNKTADVLHELQEMPTHIRLSEPVRLSVAAFTALHSDNFSRFFKVVKQCSYLQGAILHRYFTQVRKNAFRILSKGFVPQKQTAVPSSKLINCLCFNDKEELYNFCDQFSIQYTENDVMLTRQGLEEVETAMIESQSTIVTEKICNSNLGELIANEKLPEWQDVKYVPTSSFDEDGRYIGKYGQLLKSGKGFLNSEENVERIMQQQQPKKKLTAEQEKVVKAITKSIFHDVINGICESVSRECVNNEYMLKTCQEICGEIIAEETTALENTIAQEVLRQELDNLRRTLQLQIQKEKEERARQVREQEEKEKIARLKKEEQVLKERQCSLLVDGITGNVVGKYAIEIATEQIYIAKERARQSLLDKLSQVFLSELFQEVSSEIALETASSEWKIHKKSKCAESFGHFRLKQLEKHWRKWKLEKLKKVRLENARRTFPGAPHLQTTKNQLKHLVPHSATNYDLPNSFSITKSAKLTMLSPQTSMKRKNDSEMNLSKVSKRNQEFHKVAVSRIPFHDILMNMHMKDKFSQFQIFSDNKTMVFKLLNVINSSGNNAFFKWYKKLFSSCDGNFHCGVSNYNSSGNTTDVEKSHRFSVATCTKVIHSTINEISSQDIDGMSLLVYTITENMMSNASELLHEIFSVRSGNQHIPVVIVFVDFTMSYEEAVHRLKLDMTDSISSVSIVTLNSNCIEMKNFFKLVKAIEYVLMDIPSPPKLDKTTFRDLLESFIPLKYVTPLYRHIAQRAELNKPTLLPNVQVDLYNKIIINLCQAVTCTDLADIRWPAVEFDKLAKLNIPKSDWNTQKSFQQLQIVLSKALVPKFPILPHISKPEEIEEILLNYADHVVPNSLTLKSTISSKVHETLETTYQAYGNFVDKFPWCQFVEIILSEHLTNLLYYNPVGNTVIWFDPTIISKMSCLTEEFEDLMDESEFYSDPNSSHVDASTNGSMKHLNMTTVEAIERTSIMHIENQEMHTCSKGSIHFPNEQDMLSNEITLMQENIKKEKLRSVEFEDRLRKILADGELPLTILHTNTFLDNLDTSSLKSPK